MFLLHFDGTPRAMGAVANLMSGSVPVMKGIQT
jgi:hypothetical protein